MKNYLKGFDELFLINEMASTLSKLGLPKRLVGVIHKLPDKIEQIRPFTYNQGDRARQAELEPIGQNRPSHEVEVIDHFRMKKTELLGNKTADKSGPGFLSDMEKFPLAKDMRIILAVPEPGGKYAGQEPRYDYIYHKGTAWGKRHQGGGKKYRILTMDQEGNIVRDWHAYQGKLTYPRDPNNPNAPSKFRDDFKDFPTAADGKIDVYILDHETVDHETAYQDMGGSGGKRSHLVPIGKARKLGRDRKKAALYNGVAFINEFASKFENILEHLFGKRKDAAREKYRELVAAGEDISTEEMRDLQRTIQNNEAVSDNINMYYARYLKYLMTNGAYDKTSLDEIEGNDNISSSEYQKYASIEDIIEKHGKMKSLRNFAEYILTGEVDDVNKEMEVAIDEPEYSMEDEFKDLIDIDLDLENPFDED